MDQSNLTNYVFLRFESQQNTRIKSTPKQRNKQIKNTNQKKEPKAKRERKCTGKGRASKKRKLQEDLESSECSGEEAIVLDDSDDCL